MHGWRIPASFIVAMLLSGLSAALNTMYSRDVPLGHTTSQQYVIQPTLPRLLAHTGAQAVAIPLISLAVVSAIALAARRSQTRGAESVWRQLLRSWSLAQPASGSIGLVSTCGLLGLAALLQTQIVPTTGVAGPVVGLLLNLLTLLWDLAVYVYVIILFVSSVAAAVPNPPRSVGWVAVGAFLLSIVVVGVTLDLLAAALGIPGPLFG